MEPVKLILIGGTSHVGKSTLARRLAEERGWSCLSTDQLARHPGRPWKTGERDVPGDVVEHYANLSIPELVDSVLAHYRINVWPIIDAIVRSRLNNPFDPGLVFEGSAILPDLVGAAKYHRVDALWLTAPRDLIAERIRRSSGYDSRTAQERRVIDAFLERAIAIDRLLVDSVAANGLSLLDAGSEDVAASARSLT